MSLVYALTNPEEFSNEVNQVKMRSSEPTYAECLALITFTDNYLQPGLIKHNKPLFISRYLNGLGITRIMIDGGSAVNLLPFRMLKHLGIAIHQLGPSNLLIQGFNQSRQRSLGIVRLELKIEEWGDTIPLKKASGPVDPEQIGIDLVAFAVDFHPDVDPTQLTGDSHSTRSFQGE
ncbi:hypothetical protein PVK06_047578 [Gossypium arboreum]|uniref:Uncharacterized protein n=1 Tax=Gossypium arboreum TaxID=29729 RepID=A0ABR0MDM3_GOSAR|nr:hypothetical protein PVK06_047578 [Gossypium arboreum]